MFEWNVQPCGERVFVELDHPVDEITERAKRVGIVPVVKTENVPRSTTGKIIAVGDGPEIQRMVKVGYFVAFSVYAGKDIQLAGQTFRSLEIQEIIAVAKPPAEGALPEPTFRDGTQTSHPTSGA